MTFWSIPKHEEHAEYLRIVLKILWQKKLYVKLRKCEFRLESVVFLGHIVSREEILVDPSKIQVVKD